MEIDGIPLHPLVVHAAVVLTPLAALLALASLLPRWRDRLRWPLLAAALVAGGSVVLAYLSGTDFRDSERFSTASGAFADKLATHEDLGTYLLWWTVAFAAVAVVTALVHPGRGWLRWVLGALLALTALAVLVVVVVTGHSGADAVWGA